MGIDSCVIRNYCSADLDQYVRLHAEGESICHSEDTLLLASLTIESLEPINYPEKNLLLAEEQGRIVGACHLVPEPAIDRAVMRLLIRRGSSGRGIAEKLIRSALKKADGLKVAKVHADLKESDRAARDLFARLGFRPVRRYTEMTLDLKHASIVESSYEGLSLRPLKPGGETEFTRLQNRAFSGSWGFCPNTTPEIVQQLNAPGYGHSGAILAYCDEEAVGYCWTAEVRQPDQASGTATGRIHMMGVAPEFRGRGLGRQILSSALKHLASKGIRTVELTMDNENEAARALYERAGFKPKTALLWYEKKMK